MFLPEHREMLLKQREEQRRISRPALDEQQMDEINGILTRAIQEKLSVTVRFWTDGQIVECSGDVTKINIHDGWISIRQEKGSRRIHLKDILGISV